VTVTKTNMIRRNAFWLCKNHYCENTAPSLPQWLLLKSPTELLSKSPTDLRRGLRSSKIWLSYKSILVASWMHLHNSRCFQEHLRILLHSLRALCLATGGSGSIRKYVEALVRSPGVSGRIACCFQTNWHFADEVTGQWVFLNTIASMNRFVISKLNFWCWGTLWSPPAFGWGTF